MPSAHSGTNPVKCISCKQDLTVLEIRSKSPRDAEATAGVIASLCGRHNVPVEFTGIAGNALFVGVKNSARLESLAYSNDGVACLEARVHSSSALITLVGQGINSTPGLLGRVVAVLKNLQVISIPDAESGLKLSLIVPQAQMKQSIELLHRELFRRVDPTVFAESTSPQSIPQRAGASAVTADQASESQAQQLALA